MVSANQSSNNGRGTCFVVTLESRIEYIIQSIYKHVLEEKLNESIFSSRLR
jgi:hypothetical protein